MKDLFIMFVIVVIWYVANRYILPKIGIRT